MRCHKPLGMTEAFTNTLNTRPKMSNSVYQKAALATFPEQTADKFAMDYTIKNSFRHALDDYFNTVCLVQFDLILVTNSACTSSGGSKGEQGVRANPHFDPC